MIDPKDLKKQKLLSDLNDAELERIAGMVGRETYAKGAPVCRDLACSSAAASTAASSRPPRVRPWAVATLVAGLAQRELHSSGIARSFLGTAETTAMVFMIFLGADMMNASLALTAMPAALADWVGHLAVPPLAIVAAVMVFYVLLGCVMDELSMMLLTIPVIFPAVIGLDLWGLGPQDKAIWFGILVLVTVSIGLIAPPVGLNVYVACAPASTAARTLPLSPHTIVVT